jgi:hypothetical protein
VQLLRATIAGEASARGERVRELGKQACERINNRLQCRRPEHAAVRESKAHYNSDAALSHARTLDTRGV